MPARMTCTSESFNAKSYHMRVMAVLSISMKLSKECINSNSAHIYQHACLCACASIAGYLLYISAGLKEKL